MFIVLGATGHVGSAVVENLLRSGESVTAVIRHEGKAAPLRARGAAIAVVDVGDANALRAVFRGGPRAFLLNPPAPVSGDTDTEERRTASAIVEARPSKRGVWTNNAAGNFRPVDQELTAPVA